MKLSVIIPHYNSASQLPCLFDSILAECNDTEIIVVDDCSDKDVAEFDCVKNKYSNRVNFYTNDSGVKGAGAARNVGLSKASGDWYMFADSDDYFLEGWYKNVSRFMDSENDIVFFVPTSVKNDTNETGKRHITYANYAKEYLAESNHNNELNMRYLFVVPWSKMIKASVVKKNNILFDEVMYSNDVMFSVKTGFYADAIEVCGESIYCVTEQANTLTGNTSESAWHTRHKVFCERIHFLMTHLPKEDIKFAKGGATSFIRLIEAHNNGYGFKNGLKYFKDYCDKKVPIIYSFGVFCKYQIIKRIRK